MGIDSATLVNKDCTQGFICLGGSTTPTPTDGTLGKVCDPGNYCLEGTTAMVQCPGGSYEPRQGTFSASCQTCPKGYFCAAGSVFPTDCPNNYYCPVGSTAATFCPAGTYNDDQTNLESADQCKECPTGFYCTDGVIQGRCDAGYFCDYGATAADDSNKACPAGFYCPVHTDADCATADPTG